MTALKSVLDDLVKVEGINIALVVGRDGFIIEYTSKTGMLDPEAVGAVVSTGMGSSEVMGRELGVGQMLQSMIEYSSGVIVTSYLANGAAILGIVADPSANLGNIRLQVKKRTSLIEQSI